MVEGHIGDQGADRDGKGKAVVVLVGVDMFAEKQGCQHKKDETEGRSIHGHQNIFHGIFPLQG